MSAPPAKKATDALGDKLKLLATQVVDGATTQLEGEPPIALAIKLEALKVAGQFYVATKRATKGEPDEDAGSFDNIKRNLNRKDR